MGDYAVTITVPINRPIRDQEVDRLAELLGDEAAMSFSDAELSVSTSATAADPASALSLISHLVETVVLQIGVEAGPVVEAEVKEWDRFAAELEQPNLPDLVSAPEVGEILGVSRQRVHQLIKENQSFPPPLLRLGSGPLWLRATIEAFDRSWTRKPGRPAGSGRDVTVETQRTLTAVNKVGRAVRAARPRSADRAEKR